jgi:hypothetical protein
MEVGHLQLVHPSASFQDHAEVRLFADRASQARSHRDLPCLSHQWQLAFVVAPAIIPRTSLHRGLVHWMLMVVGMMWQFVVSLAVLRHELGGLHWSAV